MRIEKFVGIVAKHEKLHAAPKNAVEPRARPPVASCCFFTKTILTLLYDVIYESFTDEACRAGSNEDRRHMGSLTPFIGEPLT
jgi:hypothetical protein